jgi:hypothetical protein
MIVIQKFKKLIKLITIEDNNVLFLILELL